MHGRTSGPVYYLRGDDEWVLGELCLSDQWMTFEGSSADTVSHQTANIAAVAGLDFFNYFESFCFELQCVLPPPPPQRSRAASSARYGVYSAQQLGAGGIGAGTDSNTTNATVMGSATNNVTAANIARHDSHIRGGGGHDDDGHPHHHEPSRQHNGAAAEDHHGRGGGGAPSPPPPLISVGGATPSATNLNAPTAAAGGIVPPLDGPYGSVARAPLAASPHGSPNGLYGGSNAPDSSAAGSPAGVGVGVSAGMTLSMANNVGSPQAQGDGANAAASHQSPGGGALGRLSPVNSISAMRGGGGDGYSVTPVLSPALSFQDISTAGQHHRGAPFGGGLAGLSGYGDGHGGVAPPAASPTAFGPTPTTPSAASAGAAFTFPSPHFGSGAHLSVGAQQQQQQQQQQQPLERVVFKALSFSDYMQWLSALDMYLDLAAVNKAGLAIPSSTLEPSDEFGRLYKAFAAYGGRLPDPPRLDDGWGAELLDYPTRV